MEFLTVKDLSFRYPGSAEALSGLSFSAGRGEILLLCGEAGSGKSTLLRLLKRELRPKGTLSGSILFDGRPIEALSDREAASSVGYVMQNPEYQIVTDKVWHELAFGLENLGLPPDVIRRRVAETACYFGLEELFERPVSSLSGGQKQLLSLASVAVMRPSLLLLDEPTAQLDPISAAAFIEAVVRLSRELSITVLMAEHRTEEALPHADRLLALSAGRQLAFGETRRTLTEIGGCRGLIGELPAAVRLYARLGGTPPCPITPREGGLFLRERYDNRIRSLPEPPPPPDTGEALSLRDVFFRYGREQPDVLRGLTLQVREGEIFCLLGGNGSGKSTALSVAAGLLRPYAGQVRIFGRKLFPARAEPCRRGSVAMLPQDVTALFSAETVREELKERGETSLFFDREELLDRHPYDLSGGEQQLLALAKVLASEPRLLLLDEPTKGLDASARERLLSLLRRLRDNGVTVVAVTHDVEFAAEAADRCALLFRGELLSVGTPRRFFSENGYYTTAVCRMTRGYYDLAATVDDAEALCRANGRIGR